MSIEFVCPHCEYLLRTAADKAGMRAECPACGDPLWIPYPEELPSGGHAAAAASVEDDAWEPDSRDRYDQRRESFDDPAEDVETFDEIEDVDPEDWAEPLDADEVASEAMHEALSKNDSREWHREGELWAPRLVDPGEILTRTFELFGRNFGLLVTAGAVELVIGIVAIVVVAVPALLTAAMLWDGTPVALFVAAIVWICGFAVATSWLAVGHFRFYLKLARGEEATLADLLQAGPIAGRMTALNILFGILTIVGLMMCVIPGLFVMLVYWPYGRLLVERNLPGFTAFEASRGVTRGHLATSLVLVFTAIGATVACNVIPLGVVISVPFIGLLFSVAYLRMTRQPVGLD
ncbi:hypothetical protein Mal4_09620 [Maioricimonas rarisocia]|uniref:Uncharacterized protein n=1 Tax=Maioricimonas rarisocia TaxID=2528026 RepID=A0A517Z2G8_9PLAN|nr:hypothetical protein [Maioricimonas rarisocia]QDU36674.1 hypothetical protein Mal4_09620 [Maioricimonas rarisocia]